MDRRTFLMLTGASAAMAATQVAAAPSPGVGSVAKADAPPLIASGRALAGSSGMATVPLHLVDIGGGQSKFVIEIGLGGGEPKPYTFDTGCSGFYAARNDDWWPSYKRIGGPQISQTCGDDVDFQSKQVRTTVSIPTTSGHLEIETDVGQIHDAWGGPLGPKPRSSWRKDVAAGKPPLFGHFDGDFGSGLTEVNGLFAILPQLPGNLSSGFALRLGCQGSPSSSPTLEIEVTDAIRSEMTSWIPMHGGPRATRFPGSGLPTYSQKVLPGITR